jgi:hypothetical protein
MPDVVLLAASGLGSDRPAMTPPSAQEPLDVSLTEFGRINIMLSKPAVERRSVHRLDVHDGGDELLTNQQINEGTKMLRDWTGGAAHERGGALE